MRTIQIGAESELRANFLSSKTNLSVRSSYTSDRSSAFRLLQFDFV